jgi:hypothetical protein
MINKVKRGLSKLIRNNWVAKTFYYDPFRDKYLSKDFLLSLEYELLMTKFIQSPSEWRSFINDAENNTKNYKFRHSDDMQKKLGSWRWKPMFLNREILVPIIFNSSKKGLDIGGAYGPVSKATDIVDFNKKDIFSRPVKYSGLEDVDSKVDFVFSSHTFEHISELDDFLKKVHSLLNQNGKLIAIVPSYTCLWWRAGTHTMAAHRDHVWTFALSESKIEEQINCLRYIDEAIENLFTIETKQYSGDNSIFIIAAKK